MMFRGVASLVLPSSFDTRETGFMDRQNSRIIRADRGTVLQARSWLTEAPLRMLMNNLDPDVAERLSELVV